MDNISQAVIEDSFEDLHCADRWLVVTKIFTKMSVLYSETLRTYKYLSNIHVVLFERKLVSTTVLPAVFLIVTYLLSVSFILSWSRFALYK